jgi:hypothetical protein
MVYGYFLSLLQEVVSCLFAKLTSFAKLAVDSSTKQYAHCPPLEIDRRKNRTTKAADSSGTCGVKAAIGLLTVRL